jgi:transposase InsO family protein
VLGVSARSIQRWQAIDGGDDRRAGPKSEPHNKLSPEEREEIIAIVTSPEYRDLSVSQIVPILADQGLYIASESTMYRLLREVRLLQHRAASKPPTHQRPKEFVATRPNQVWSWDISYLSLGGRGAFCYLYMIIDVFSRKIVGHAVHDVESAEMGRKLVEDSIRRECPDNPPKVLHADNGAPMTAATMMCTLQELGIFASFSRPGVSDDNPFSEAVFKTAKYRPEYPGYFQSLEDARRWASEFVDWYNHQHRHSGIRFVTPSQRHSGEDIEVLANRVVVYETARRRNPSRWTGPTRNWSRPDKVRLNPRPAEEAAA